LYINVIEDLSAFKLKDLLESSLIAVASLQGFMHLTPVKASHPYVQSIVAKWKT
jgi:hypothetical protein